VTAQQTEMLLECGVDANWMHTSESDAQEVPGAYSCQTRNHVFARVTSLFTRSLRERKERTCNSENMRKVLYTVMNFWRVRLRRKVTRAATSVPIVTAPIRTYRYPLSEQIEC
jgi:hypothetical protein